VEENPTTPTHTMVHTEFKLFVGGLSWATDDAMLRSAFEKFGDIAL
jgi:hypothetical protein